jgi:hypothetical protein
LTFTNTLTALLASRMAFDVYGEPDKVALVIFFACLLAAYAAGGFTNYFLRRPFVADTVFFTVTMIVVAFVLINLFDKEGTFQKQFGKGVDWRVMRASVLILFALWIIAGIALACSTRWELVPSLMICSALFLLGLVSDYFFGTRAEHGSWWAKIVYTAAPNWQLFWLADALENKRNIPWRYVATSFGYVAAYLGVVLAAALLLFQDRELT